MLFLGWLLMMLLLGVLDVANVAFGLTVLGLRGVWLILCWVLSGSCD